MKAILKRELGIYFFSPLGYVLLGVYWLLNGLLLWIFPTNFNLLNAGFGDLNLFFELNPWLLLFIIPALGMKSFAEEIKLGTLELLLSKPLSKIGLILGKYLAMLLLLSIGLAVAFLYAYLLNGLILENHSFDGGVFTGAYLGLFLLIAVFAAISLWASTLGNSPFAAFFIAFFVALFHYYGWQQFAMLFSDFTSYQWIRSLGLQHHYGALNQGVIRISNMIYLLGQTVFFLYWASVNLQNKRQ